MSNPKYTQEEEAFVQECKDLISTLPTEKGWFAPHIYQYQGFWYLASNLQALISCQKQFQAQDSDVLLVTNPKSGTTWFKSIIFTLLNRKTYPVATNHPLLTHNPHDLVLSLEINIYADNQFPDFASFPSPRFFSTHISYSSLPESVRNGTSSCKIVYVCRNPKDTFVSLWHFMNKLLPQEIGTNSIGQVLEMFCKGSLPFGPFWDQALEYWKQSKENPENVLFMKYEDMKEKPGLHLRRLADFLNCPFSADEEQSGLVEEILKLTSFDHLSNLEVNKNGILSNGMANSAFFRRGQVGDWKNILSSEMIQKLDRVTEEKFFGSGLVL
ncbi:hypothetical protein ACS0TY_008207 [Phlomoides rotata]